VKSNKEVKLSRAQAPADLSPVDWQRALRRQFGREQSFMLENLGDDPFFSEFRVTNPDSKSSYRVAVRAPASKISGFRCRPRRWRDNWPMFSRR
jgi:hypothetical protein